MSYYSSSCFQIFFPKKKEIYFSFLSSKNRFFFIWKEKKSCFFSLRIYTKKRGQGYIFVYRREIKKKINGYLSIYLSIYYLIIAN